MPYISYIPYISYTLYNIYTTCMHAHHHHHRRSEKTVVSSLEGPVGIVTLNRPHKLNALNLDMVRALREVYDAWLLLKGSNSTSTSSPTAKCIIMRGAGILSAPHPHPHPSPLTPHPHPYSYPHPPYPHPHRHPTHTPNRNLGPRIDFVCSLQPPPPPSPYFLVVRHVKGEKGFCAGGDVASVQIASLAGESLPQDFFYEEYQLNNIIATMFERKVKGLLTLTRKHMALSQPPFVGVCARSRLFFWR
jgi:hypothetical protein